VATIGTAFVRGRRKLELIQELAAQIRPNAELMEKYDVANTAFYRFIRENQTEIEEARAALVQDLNDEVAGLWVAKKANRIAEYQQDIEDINRQLDVGLEPSLLRQKHNALKAVAEELGSLPVRAAPVKDSGGLVITVTGIDEGALK